MSTLADVMGPDAGADLFRASDLVKEGLQELILRSMSKAEFFESALFHGGHALASSTDWTVSLKISTSP